MRLDGDGGDLIIEIRLTEEGCYKSATRGAVHVTHEFSLVLGRKAHKPRVRSPALDQRRVFEGELHRRMHALGKLIARREIAASDDVESVRLDWGVVCTRSKSVYLREGRVFHFVCLLDV